MENTCQNQNGPVRWLEDEFIRRKQTRPEYSLRQFAKRLEIPPGRLSEILSGKRTLSISLAEKIITKLALKGDQRQELLSKVISQRIDSLPSTDAARSENQISDDVFRVIADWYHFAILSLIRTDNFDPSPAKISKRLGISIIETRQALKRLESLNMIKKSGNTWLRTTENLATTWDIPSAALKETHKQELERAIKSMHTVPVNQRDISAFTMPINMEQLPKAKKLIREFQTSMEEILESGRKTEVYTLNIQLLPVTVGVTS